MTRLTREFRCFLFYIFLPLVAHAAIFGGDSTPCIGSTGATYETAFSTGQAISPLVIKSIASAKKTLRVSARHFNSKTVSIALVQAARSGVDLKLVLDSKLNNNDYSAAAFLRTMNIIPHVLKNYDNLYSDYILIDDKDIILGNAAGFQDEDAERKSASSVLIIHNSPELTKQYTANWQALWSSSEEMVKAKGGGLHDPM